MVYHRQKICMVIWSLLTGVLPKSISKRTERGQPCPRSGNARNTAKTPLGRTRGQGCPRSGPLGQHALTSAATSLVKYAGLMVALGAGFPELRGRGATASDSIPSSNLIVNGDFEQVAASYVPRGW